MPLRISSAGEPIAPALTTTWRARITCSAPSTTTRSPTARPFSTTTRRTCVIGSKVRFGRRRTASVRYATAVLARCPRSSTLIEVGMIPVRQGPFWSSANSSPYGFTASATAFVNPVHWLRGICWIGSGPSLPCSSP